MRQHILYILLGALLILTAVPSSSIGVHSEQRQLTGNGPERCRGGLDRPVPAEDKDPAVTGLIERLNGNSSIVTISYRRTSNSSGGKVTFGLPQGASILDYENMDRDGRRFTANLEDTSKFSITYSVGKTFNGTSYTSGRNWTIAPLPDHNPQTVVLQTSSEGFIGRNYVYLGEFETHSTEVTCQTITIIEPEAASVDETHRLNVLEAAARKLKTGKAYKDVYIFASPKKPGNRNGYVLEFEGDIFVYAGDESRSPTNTWIHEYIHTRQASSIQNSESMKWFAEASAMYYTARIALETDLIEPMEYDRFLHTKRSYNPSTPLHAADDEDVAYRWGAVLLAYLDAVLSEHTSYTLMDVFYRINQYSVTYDEFQKELSRADTVPNGTLETTHDVVFNGSRPPVEPALETRHELIPTKVHRSLVKGALMLRLLMFLTGVALVVGGFHGMWTEEIEQDVEFFDRE